MVVFGAGASYDSSTDHLAPLAGEADELYIRRKDASGFYPRGIRPPLASQLFELRSIFADAAQSLPKCQVPIDDLRHLKPDMSVEQQLEKMREAALSYPEGQKQLASIRFYLQWIIRRCQSLWNNEIKSQTTCRVLLGQIDRQLKGEPACFVTFNYDTLLEEAFTSLDIKFESLDDYISRSTYKVIKLHGSTNWARELSSPIPVRMGDHVQFANNILASADKLETSNNYHLIPRDDRSESITSFMKIPGKPDRQAVLPAIAIPLEKKHSYECPTEHAHVLEGCIPKTDKLLIVGWKGAEENFVNLLAKGLKKNIPKMIVSRTPDSAEKIRSSLMESGIDGAHWNVNEGGFAEQVRSGRIENFVRQV
jgi:hypothetical protein